MKYSGRTLSTDALFQLTERWAKQTLTHEWTSVKVDPNA